MKRYLRVQSQHGSSTPSRQSTQAIFKPQGGLALPRNKVGLPGVGEAIREITLPEQLTLPLLDYAKQPLKASVPVGARVSPGDMLAPGVLAPAFGVVTAIEPRAIIHPSKKPAMCIVIDVDPYQPPSYRSLPALDEPSVQRLVNAGISGLGGAGFNTGYKYTAAQQGEDAIDTLLVNAVECEPLISCDEALILSNASAIVKAIHLMIRLSACRRCILAIEDDKSDAITELQNQINAQTRSSADTQIELLALSAIYPSGAEKVLIQRLTGSLPESSQRASDQGILCLNVATVFAAWQAQQGQPLLSRIVTIAGDRALNHTNVRVFFGTAVSHVLQQTDNLPDSASISVRAGGPLSGIELDDISVPVTATCNCLSIEPAAEQVIAEPCIRCGYCSDVCPVNLVPQQLFWHAHGDDMSGALHYGLDNCIECGCCDVVCPSSIRLTDTFRYARSTVREQRYQKKSAELARARFEQHEVRVREREQEVQRIREQKKSQLASSEDTIARALARSRARKKKH